jgi:hypothetical protein
VPPTTGKTIAHPTAPGATPCPTCGANINGIVGPYDEDKPPQFSDVFVTKLNPTASGATALLYSSYLGGSGDDVGHGVVHSTVLGAHGVYVVGLSTSSTLAPPPKPPDPPGTSPPTPPWPSPWYGYPTTTGAFQTTSSPDRTTECNCGTPLPAVPNEETFVTRLNDNADESPAPPVGSTPTGPAFTLAPTPSSMSINKNGSGTFTVSVTPDAGFTGNVTLTHSSNPATGLTVAPATATVAAPGSANFNVTASATAGGTYTITVTGTSGTTTKTTTVTVNVPDFSVSANPSTVSFAGDGGTGTFSASVAALGGFTGNVTLTHSSNPAAGLTVMPASATVAAGGSQTFNVTATAAGNYTITVTGTGTVPGIGSATHTTTVNVTVRPPDFSLVPTPSTVTFTKDGGSGTFNVAVAPVDGFNGPVTLTHSSTPGLTVNPPSATVAATGSATFTASSTTPGTYTVTVTGTGTDSWNGSPVSHTTTVTVHVADNTGFLNPTANSAANSAGDGNGFEVSPTNAYTNNGLFAVDMNSGTGTGTACTSQNKDSHRFFNYGFSLPSGATIFGLEVRLDAKVDSTAGTPKMCVQLSWNGGNSWTTLKSTPTLTTTEATYILGGASDTWGRTWSLANLSNASFQVRVIDVSGVLTSDFYLDWIAVKAHFL